MLNYIDPAYGVSLLWPCV